MTTINSDITALFPKAGGSAAKLTDEQKTAAEEILAQYDPEQLSEEDVEQIKQQLRDVGIAPSRDLKGLLEEAGFDAEQFRPQRPGGSGGPPDGAPPPPPELSEEEVQTLASIFEAYDAENLSEDDLQEIQKKLQEAGFLSRGAVVDQQA
jgi:mono/diheme cytochrome c family protein